jgi:hypothetical protein
MEGMIDLDAFDADDAPNDENYEKAENVSTEIDGASFDESDEDAQISTTMELIRRMKVVTYHETPMGTTLMMK